MGEVLEKLKVLEVNKPVRDYLTGFIPILLSYCLFLLVKILQEFVTLNPNNQLLLNRAPYLDLFLLRTTRSKT